MRRGQAKRSAGRRGVTLLEMLVVVALVVLMMLILASIFQAATGAMTAMRTYQELDDGLRLLDQTMRSDLSGVTAKMTPPNNPAWKSGYFEYGENAPADLQGEDTDDYLAFTCKAPEGRVFTGRFWVPFNISPSGNSSSAGNASGGAPGQNFGSLPMTITSKYAEIIYFLRNGNLYRRVLLVVPERRGALASQGSATQNAFPANQYQPNIYKVGNTSYGSLATGSITTGFFSVNDISVRPNDGPDLTASIPNQMPVPNDLGDLTNRENRAFRQRFSRDYFDAVGFSGNPPSGAGHRDGIPDDGNADLIPDYYPTLTWNWVNAEYVALSGNQAYTGQMNESTLPSSPPRITPPGSGYDLYAFPFIFPGMYSVPEPNSIDGAKYSVPVGWLHAVDPKAEAGVVGGTGVYANHAPVDIGDSLPLPSGFQTWWGFPTFRETASFRWIDPVYFPEVLNGLSGVYSQGQQVHGLQTFPTGTAPTASSKFNKNFLPAVGTMPPLGTPGAPNIPYGFDGAGNPIIVGGTTSTSNPFITLTNGVQVSQSTTGEVLSYVWDDDLIMTGVRSFDVKALDVNASIYQLGSLATINPGAIGVGAGYWDLGYASSVLFANGNTSLLTGTTIKNGSATISITDNAYGSGLGNPIGFGHEGRMPPNSTDLRLDPQRPITSLGFNNIGDDGSGQPRLRRVWDSWSTDYTNAPAIDVNGNGSTYLTGGADRPVYPSYPPPYPQALRGIQIQIRVVDPRNEKVKVLTIRQDFSDKL